MRLTLNAHILEGAALYIKNWSPTNMEKISITDTNIVSMKFGRLVQLLKTYRKPSGNHALEVCYLGLKLQI